MSYDRTYKNTNRDYIYRYIYLFCYAPITETGLTLKSSVFHLSARVYFAVALYIKT